MSDRPETETSMTDPAELAQLRAAAVAAASEPDLRERVKALTARTLHERRLVVEDVRAIVAAVTTGVGEGLSARGGEIREGLKQAVAGVDDAVGSAAQAASYALQEAVSKGRDYKDNELKASLEQLRDLESQLVGTLRQIAEQSRGKLKEELDSLSAHMKHGGTRTGEQVHEALQRLALGVKASADAGRAGLNESAGTAIDRLAQVASGVLEAVSESLKRQSERLRS